MVYLVVMKLNLDSDELSKSEPSVLTAIEHILRSFLRRVHKLQGRTDLEPEEQESDKSKELPEDPPSDIVGDVLIKQFKQQQRQASIPRRESGWMSGATGSAGSLNDRHV
jgi:hypothetical protein